VVPKNTALPYLPGRFLRWRNALGVDGVQLNPEARQLDATSESTKDTRYRHGGLMNTIGSLLELRHDAAISSKKKVDMRYGKRPNLR